MNAESHYDELTPTLQFGLSDPFATRPLALGVALAPGVVASISAQAQTFTLLYSFTGLSDGAFPYAGLIRDGAGSLYGTTSAGGGASGNGTVFKLDITGNLIVLHCFTGGADGAYPYAGLIRDAADNLYGTTHSGGLHDAGTVFKVHVGTGTEKLLDRLGRFGAG